MKKNDMLPIFAAIFIALLVVPLAGMSAAYAAVPTTSGIGSVVTIPEDDLKRNIGVMVLGLDPADSMSVLTNAGGWYEDSTCTADATFTVTVGPELSSEPIVVVEGTGNMGTVVVYQRTAGTGGVCVKHTFLLGWPKDYAPGMELLSQHKILATLNGVPTTPNGAWWCEVIEKEKAKMPPHNSKDPSTRQFDDEIIRTTVRDVSSNFICKVWWVKPGVGVLDVYFVGPRVSDFIADHILIVTMSWKVGRNTVWASEMQDICILGWSMGRETLKIWLFSNPGKSTWPAGQEYYYSWDDAIGPFASCDEAGAWQRAWLAGGWGYPA
jgi:hypothetical protein